MTEALNFTTKAIDGLAKVAALPTIVPSDKAGLRFIQQLLMRAEVFTLPDAGELLDRSKPRPEMPGIMLHPPFPVVALEYRAVARDTVPDPLYEATVCSKRIALAWQWDGTLPRGFDPPPGNMPPAGEGVFITSVCYFDAMGIWMPMSGAILLPFDFEYVVGEPTHHQLALIASKRISKQQAAAPKIPVKNIMLIMPEWFARTAAAHGPRSIEMLGADLMDEVNAYIDLCLALACRNVSAEKREQPSKLNRARMKAGKPPLKDFHVLTIAGEDYASGTRSGANGTGVRSHLRRGHIRRLGPERVTWVNSCMVRGSRPGFIDKQYAPVPEPHA